MPRCWIVSDLHLLPGAPVRLAVPHADVALVAGDVGEGLVESVRAVATLLRPHMRVVLVPGNHDFYGTIADRERRDARAVAAELGVDLLDDAAVTIGGVRYLGATLWTDYALEGVARRPLAMAAAMRGMADHRRILMSGATLARRFLPADALDLHEASVRFLEAEAVRHRTGPLVVVTHHGPTARSLDPAFEEDPLNSAFASELDGLVERLAPELWVHGHVHRGRDYPVGRTRVLCNPRGQGRENPSFDPSLVVAVGGDG